MGCVTSELGHVTVLTMRYKDPWFMILACMLLQSTVILRAEIDRDYNHLFHETEEFLTELHSRQEQQRMQEEEASKLKKLREEEASTQP